MGNETYIQTPDTSYTGYGDARRVFGASEVKVILNTELSEQGKQSLTLVREWDHSADLFPDKVHLYHHKINDKDKIVTSVIHLHADQGFIGLEATLAEINNSGLKPAEIIIPIDEEKDENSLVRHFSEAHHIKTLHLKLSYEGNEVSEVKAEYYDSKPWNNGIYPGARAKAMVEKHFGKNKSGTNKLTHWENVSLNDHQKQFNASDCGFWTLAYVFALFQGKSSDDIKKITLPETQIKQDYIEANLKFLEVDLAKTARESDELLSNTSFSDKKMDDDDAAQGWGDTQLDRGTIKNEEAQDQQYYQQANKLYQLITSGQYQNNGKKSAALDVLYQVMLVKNGTITPKQKTELLIQTEFIFTGTHPNSKQTLTETDIKHYVASSEQYKMSLSFTPTKSTLMGAIFVLASLAVIILAVLTLIPSCGVSLPLAGCAIGALAGWFGLGVVGTTAGAGVATKPALCTMYNNQYRSIPSAAKELANEAAKGLKTLTPQ